MRDIKYDTVLRKCRENDAAEMYVANTIWPTDEGPVSGKAVAAALATKQPLITPEHKLPAELVEGGGTGSAAWGKIEGDIADQEDLKQALGGKLDTDAVGVTVAGLVDGKVPAEELPSLDFIPTAEKGVANGVAELDGEAKVNRDVLPLCNSTSVGAVRSGSGATQYGINIVDGYVRIVRATESNIDDKAGIYKPIVPTSLDYAVRSVLPNVTTIPAATAAYSLLDASATTNNHSFTYTHVPAEASVYTLPAVTNTAVSHLILLYVDFTNTQSISFEDSNNQTISPSFTPTISAGDVYCFKCEYSILKNAWQIIPCKQGATSDDYVMQSEVGVAGGVASLGSNGKVLTTELPVSPTYGTTILQGVLAINPAGTSEINGRSGGFRAITAGTLNQSVTAALTDAHKISLTDAQKASAQDTLGAYGTLHLDAAPTTSTVGAFGQRAIVDSTGKAYTCTAVTNTGTEAEPAYSYTWTDDINAKGGTFDGSVRIAGDLIIGTSTASVSGTGNDNGLYIGNHGQTPKSSIACGVYLYNYHSQSIAIGSGYVSKNIVLYLKGTGGGWLFEGDDTGNFLVSGSYQNVITTIPSGSSEYHLTEGNSQHVPNASPTYILPFTTRIVVESANYQRNYYDRVPSLDGSGYYAWAIPGTNDTRYTATATPAVGDNTYTNTALTSGAKTVKELDNRTHEITLEVLFAAYTRYTDGDSGSAYAWKYGSSILYTNTATPTAGTTVAYSDTALETSAGTIALYDSTSNAISMVGSYTFEDAAGNEITPKPLVGTIKPGCVVQFLCEWDSLTSQWVIYTVEG